MRLSQTVESILANNPRARDSDSELVIEVLQGLGANLSEYQLSVIRSINLESVRRLRQKLQEQGKYAPSPVVAKQRRLKSYIVQQNAPTASPERLERLVADQPEPIFLDDGEIF